MRSDIIKKLKLLQKIEPNAEWKKTNRNFLISQIKNSSADYSSETNWASGMVKIFFPWRTMKFVFRPALTFLSIIGLILGSGFSVSASQLSLPGDALYPLKIATEKVQVALTFDKGEQAKLHVELAGKRIDEAKKIKDIVANAPQDKGRKIKIAVEKFHQEMQTVKNDLEKTDPKQPKIFEVAKIVDSKVNEYEAALTDIQTDETAAAAVEKGLDLTDKTGDQALRVIVGTHSEGTTPLSEQDVLKRVENKIATIETKVTEISNQVNLIGESTPALVAKEAGEKIQEAQGILAQAKEALNQKNASIAVEKVFESKGLARQAEQMISDFVLLAVPIQEEPSADCQETNINTAEDSTSPEATNTNTDLTNTNTNTVIEPVKVYIQPIAKPVLTNTNTNTNTNTTVAPEPEIVDESQLKVGIDLRQEPSE